MRRLRGEVPTRMRPLLLLPRGNRGRRPELSASADIDLERPSTAGTPRRSGLGSPWTPLPPPRAVIAGLPGLREVRSVSKFGFSQITAIFDDGTDVYLARQVVGERLQSVELPDGVGRPSLGPISTGLGEVFQYLVESDGP